MFELSALGLLQREPLHGYRLKQKLELFMSSCISVNYGAIYPLLHRLEERGYIHTLTEEAGDAGTTRKIYAITQKGRDRWREKMLEQPQDSWVKSRARFMVKFVFFEDLELENRVKLIQHRLRACQTRREYVDSQDFPDDRYHQAAVERHLEMLEREVAWLKQQLAQESVREVEELQSSART